MSADWTTARVVRAGGELWGRSDGNWWSKLGYYWPISEYDPEAVQSTPSLAEYDPTPVLDAEGLPVVRTVGDLTARHIGRRVRVEGWGETVFREVFPTQHGARCMFADGDHEFAATIDIPCEVLP